MGGAGESQKCQQDKEGLPPAAPRSAEPGDPFSDVRLQDAPVLLLACFHKALRGEIADLLRLAVTTSESGSCGRELLLELHRRLDFLKLAYKYHCTAEDEVIFSALDVHVKNITGTYSLEHKSIDDLFDSLFHHLNVLMVDIKNCGKLLQELVLCISTMQSSICHHMLKEEQQVFPLLMQNFSPKEQTLLVQQFICSVPVILLEALLPWMMSFICPEKRDDVTSCMRHIMPSESSLQQVLVSWLHRDYQCFSWNLNKIGKGSHDESARMKNKPEPHSSKQSLGENWQGEKQYCIQTDVGNSPVNYLHLWHGAIQKELNEILEESHQIRGSSCFPDIDSIVVRVKFLADVIIFYSNALKTFFYPIFTELGNNHLSTSSTEQASLESCIENLHRLLHYNDQNSLPLWKFVDNLCQELGNFATVTGKEFLFQQSEVFPFISKNCSISTQQHILYMSLHMMPIGLLRCTITWFAAHLSKNDSRLILHSINLGDILANKSLGSLLLEWFMSGYSNPVENFGIYLQKIFKSRCSFLLKQMMQCEESSPTKAEPVSADKGKQLLSCSGSHRDDIFETLYSSEITLRILFPGTTNTLQPITKFPGEASSINSIVKEPLPIDLIFFFHKALKKDLDSLVLSSAQLADNFELLMEVHQHFYLLHSRCKFLSEAEDEIVFPALEAKEKFQNISCSYAIDHKFEAKHFNEISLILDELSKLQNSVSDNGSNMQDEEMGNHIQLCKKLHNECKAIHKLLFDHIHREEIELFTIFKEYFSAQEQEKVIGNILGRSRAETVQDMIPWLCRYLKLDEQNAMMSLWRKVTKNTMFDEWLREWWECYDIAHVAEDLNTSCSLDSLEFVSKYLSKEVFDKEGEIPGDKGPPILKQECLVVDTKMLGKCNLDKKEKIFNEDRETYECSGYGKLLNKDDYKRGHEVAEVTYKIDKTKLQQTQSTLESRHLDQLLTLSQEHLEAAVRKVSSDSSLDSQKKSYLIQNLIVSRWILQRQKSHTEVTSPNDGQEIQGQHPSYRDPLKLILGCKHYKRNCKLVTACCNQLYTCIRCHDEETEHSTDRRAITKMMCMKCLVIQPIDQTCSTVSCNNLLMARYYCRICKLFDDEREIYHCPYCNLCRVGRGLGIDYFHCMNCNACMSRSLSVHVCREKCLEDNCPICREYIFTSNIPLKALPCGHLMHSTCFQDYTYTHYTCPLCSKSLGDMEVYFKMLDALLAEEKTPEEYSGKTQVILCNDCEKKGAAPFHWLYHKCSYCGSYNTRLL